MVDSFPSTSILQTAILTNLRSTAVTLGTAWLIAGAPAHEPNLGRAPSADALAWDLLDEGMRSRFETLLRGMMLVDLARGLRVTMSNLFAKKVTVKFPEEQTPKSPRFRGLHALRRYPNGKERCIACKLCEAVCPALAITIDTDVGDDGVRRTTRYDIDLFKCIYCGFCEEACPVDAIVETRIDAYHMERRGENILTKDMLLAIGDRYEGQIKADRAADAAYR